MHRRRGQLTTRAADGSGGGRVGRCRHIVAEVVALNRDRTQLLAVHSS
jgi:hypothetical protein